MNIITSLAELIAGRQHNRALRISFPNDDGPSSELLINKLDGTESLSRDFEFTLELISSDAKIPLKDLQGKLLSVQLVRVDGTLRYFTGYVFSFQRQRTDGGITFYQAKIGPWMKFLSLRKNNVLFHQKTLRDQMEAIFSDYNNLPNWKWSVFGADPIMTDACQFDESDFNYLSRRWEAAGWFYWYEHTQNGHELVLADDSVQAPVVDGNASIRFHSGGSEEEDAFDEWSPIRHITPSSVTLKSFNFKDLTPNEVNNPTITKQGEVPAIDSYEYVGAYGFKNSDGSRKLGDLRMEEFEVKTKYVEAQGNNRRVMPGRYFKLTDHYSFSPFSRTDEAGKDEFLVLEVCHHATNNYLQESNGGDYRNEVICIRKDIHWRPGRNFNSTPTKILAPQTATVVGPQGADSIYTDEYGRVRVEFHWDRIGTNTESSSAWIRVTSSWAGAQLGAMALPRVGSEVVVQWLDGNPDRPIITGSVYNERNMPPWTLSTQQSLTGFRSRELTADGGGNKAAGRSNHLILDDSNGKIQAQLKSDHQSSQLSLGHITLIEDTEGRKNERGEGWNLFTKAWGVGRACMGLMLTTEPLDESSPMKGLGATAQRLTNAEAQQTNLAGLAEQAGAQEAQAQQRDVAVKLKAQNASIQGTGSSSSQGSFPELSEPHLVLASPAGIATTTAKSTHIASDINTAITTGQSLSIATGNGLFASITQTFRLFVQKAGMKLIAAAGDVDVQALTDSIKLLAKLQITHTAETITITASKEVLLNGGGSYIKLSNAGIEQGTNGVFNVHAASFNFDGPQSMDAKVLLPTHGGHDPDGSFIFSA